MAKRRRESWAYVSSSTPVQPTGQRSSRHEPSPNDRDVVFLRETTERSVSLFLDLYSTLSTGLIIPWLKLLFWITGAQALQTLRCWLSDLSRGSHE